MNQPQNKNGTRQRLREACKEIGFTDSATVEQAGQKTKLETKRQSSNSKGRYTTVYRVQTESSMLKRRVMQTTGKILEDG